MHAQNPWNVDRHPCYVGAVASVLSPHHSWLGCPDYDLQKVPCLAVVSIFVITKTANSTLAPEALFVDPISSALCQRTRCHKILWIPYSVRSYIMVCI